MKFVLKVKDIEFEADNIDHADGIGMDIANDIAHDGNYTIEVAK